MNKPKTSLDMEEELDKQFPKGDKVRGKALVLFAIHKIKLADQKAKYRKWLKNMCKWNGTLLKEFEELK